MPKTDSQRQAERRAKILALTPLERIRRKLERARSYTRPAGPVYTPAEQATVNMISTYITEIRHLTDQLNQDLRVRLLKTPEDADAIMEAQAMLAELERDVRIVLKTY